MRNLHQIVHMKLFLMIYCCVNKMIKTVSVNKDPDGKILMETVKVKFKIGNNILDNSQYSLIDPLCIDYILHS